MIHKHPHILIIQNTHTPTHTPPFFLLPQTRITCPHGSKLEKKQEGHSESLTQPSRREFPKNCLVVGSQYRNSRTSIGGAVFKRHSFRGVNIINHVSFISNRWQLTASFAKIRAEQSRAEHKLSLSLAITSNQDCKGASCKLRFGKKKILGQNWIYNRSGGLLVCA